MTTQIEALKLALEALKHTHPSPLTSFYTIGDRDKAIKTIEEHLAQPERHELQAEGKHPSPCARFCEANAFQIEIRNLKAQLAQPEQSENSDFQPDWMNYQQGYMDGMSQAIADMALEKDKPQPKEPEQQPVAWPVEEQPDGSVIPIDPSEMTAEQLQRYTTSPQRTWVGLTDEEKADLFAGTAPYYNEADYANAIEAKLKEKNT